MKEYYKGWYEKNKKKKLEENKTVVLCEECKRNYTKGNYSHHKSTKLHKYYSEIFSEKKEV
jgi:hypothetical protein